MISTARLMTPYHVLTSTRYVMWAASDHVPLSCRLFQLRYFIYVRSQTVSAVQRADILRSFSEFSV